MNPLIICSNLIIARHFSNVCCISFTFSADNQRIKLQKSRDGSCKVIIDHVQTRDNGEWKVFIEYGKGEDKTLHEYQHHVSVKRKSNTCSIKINSYSLL